MCRRGATRLWNLENLSVKTRTHFAHRIDRLDDPGELIEHLAD
jgi:hypothetical protein